MKVACYIPIKLNSTRTPGKNIKPLGDGTPLCKLVFKTLAQVKMQFVGKNIRSRCGLYDCQTTILGVKKQEVNI
jgi:spore coat polysaccharide biosynthesis protein SpsF (cytidylyltransferase family)